MSEPGNTGVAGGTKGASPVPTTAPDGSTVLDPSSDQVVDTEFKGETSDQNKGYRVSPYDPDSEEPAVG